MSAGRPGLAHSRLITARRNQPRARKTEAGNAAQESADVGDAAGAERAGKAVGTGEAEGTGEAGDAG